MASFESIRSLSVEAAIDLTGFLHHFGIIDSAGQLDTGTTALAAQGVVNGIVGEEVSEQGRVTSMDLPDAGRAKVKAGATLAIGDKVATAADGRAIEFVDAAGNICWGTVLKAGAANEIIEIQFFHRETGAGT